MFFGIVWFRTQLLILYFSTSEEPSSRSGWSAKRKAKKPVGEQLKLNKVLEGLNLYDILKVSPTATQDQIKKSYRRTDLFVQAPLFKSCSVLFSTRTRGGAIDVQFRGLEMTQQISIR
ncbi:DnaJ (Hsp40), sub C, member 2 [Perkinsus olseni]|uniref:DnaJ (Hsp40), sub C, member 2 n=1 Tax=Perkinsus olseni TaxID=32597 RepID=A0A7J6UFI4_PEROL|nr:DnaJ (Hsp40), sub C, member 2 [Perkinsus olseni]